MKTFYSIIVVCLALASCTKQEVIDTGTANPRFEGSMLAYLRSDNYNWALTVELIEHAGLTDLFDGKDLANPQITFFGFKSYSVLRFLYDSQFKDQSQGVFTKVQDIPVELAKALVLRHVVVGKHLKADVAYRNKEFQISDPRQDGGTDYTTLQGNVLRAYLEGSPYAGVPDAGPVILNLYSLTATRIIPMATPDIQPDNGVVHALNYGYEFGKI